MRKAALTFFCLLLVSPAGAQSLLGGAPVDVSIGAVANITRIDDAFAISGKAELAMKQAPRTFEALLSAANRKFSCGRNGWVRSAKFSNISIEPTGWTLANAALPVSVDVHAELCGLLPAMDVRVTVPIQVAAPGKSGLQAPFLLAGGPSVVAIGFVSAGVDRVVHQRLVAIARREVDPLVAQLNAAISRVVARAKAFAGSRAAVEAVSIKSDGSTLNVNVSFLGQVSTKTVSGWLGGI